MRGLLWIVALGACGSSAGVQISVQDNNLGATTARIFIGTGDPATRTITVKSAMFPDAQVWFRDPGVNDDSAPMSGGHADFFFEPSGGPTRMPIAIAVGFDASGGQVGAGELMAIDVPGTGYVHYDLPLTKSPTGYTWDAGDKTASAPSNSCAQFGGHLVVTFEDQDCDGNVDGSPKECQPDVYEGGTRAAAPGEFTCLTASPNAGPTMGGCVAGGPTCTDGMGPAQLSCSPSNYCAPSDLCRVCSATTGPGMTAVGDFACAETGGSLQFAAVPRFECTIATHHDGQLCGDPVVLPQGTGTNCSNVQLRTDQQNFQSSLQVDRGNTSMTFQTSNQGCEITITPSGNIDPATVTGPDGLRALMAVDTAPFQGFLVPITFTFAVGQSGGGGGSGGGSCGPGTSHCDPSVPGMTSDETVCTIVEIKPG